MKGLSIFLGGIAVGAVAGLLLAPDKGSETRERVREYLKKKGILPSNEIDILIEELSSETEGTGFDAAYRPSEKDKTE